MRQETDPVCGMSVDPANAPAESSHGGHTHYFCSENCKQRFDSNPSAYGDTHMANSSQSEGMEQHEPPRTTQGGITLPKFGSSTSGGGELDPVPERHD